MTTCKFFLRGKCNRGDNCSYRHPPVDLPVASTSVFTSSLRPHAPEFRPAISPKPCTFYLSNRCRNGDQCTFLHASVPTVSNASFAAAHVASLQSTADHTTIERYLKGACVSFGSGAQVLKARLPSETVGNGNGNGLARQGRAQVSTVICSWFNPSRIIWLHYRSDAWASRAIRRFTSKFHDRLVKTTMQPPPKSHGLSKVIWSVQLSNIPADVTKEEIQAHLKGVEPDNIVLGRPTSEKALLGQDAVKFVKDLFGRSGRKLHSIELEPTTTGSRTKAFARFDRVSDARSVLAYNGTEIRELGSKLFVDQIAAVKIPVIGDLYAVLKDKVHQLQATNQDDVRISAHDRQRLKIVDLRIYGLNAPAVARVNAQIRQMLVGTVVLNDCGTALWHEFFGTSEGSSALKSISKAGKVFLYRDTRRRQVLFFGSKSIFGNTRRAIIDALVSHESAYLLFLEGDLLGKALSGGFRAIVRIFGRKNAKLDILCQPPAILFKGNPEQFDTVKALISSPDPQDPDPNGECPCCFTTVDDPVELCCGHTYCRDCFETLCRDVSGSESPIACFASLSNCGHLVSLDKIQKTLDANTLESVLETSFEQYIRSKPEEIQYCPTPDCPTIYKVSKEPSVFSCTNCLISICSKCRVLSHEGLTCEDVERQGKPGEEVSDEDKKKLGVKNCPNCNVLIQKMDGCNHVTCTCGVHICWFCSKTFTTGQECYDHMTAKHGNFGDLDADEEQLREFGFGAFQPLNFEVLANFQAAFGI